MERISRDAVFMEVARLFGQRSTCPRGQVGAIAVVEGRILSTGYVGAPAGLAHCTEVGCELGEDGGCIRSVHAEANVVAWAARQGVSLEDATIYTTLATCLGCAKLLSNAGIAQVVYDQSYRSSAGIQLLTQMHILVRRYRAPSS